MSKVNLNSLRLELAVKASELPKIDGDYWKIQHKSNPKPQASTDRHR